MEWYDTYRTTKINYVLVDFSLALAPLILFYVQAFLDRHWQFKKVYLWHFLPMAMYLVFKVVIYIHDLNQTGFSEVQNGEWLLSIEYKFVEPLIVIIKSIQMPLYLAFAFQVYIKHRNEVDNGDSTFQKWVLYLLSIYTFLFLYNIFQIVVDRTIVDLTWIQKWWYFLISSFAIVFVGTRGYFVLPGWAQGLKKELEAKKGRPKNILSESSLAQKEQLLNYMEKEKPFLDQELTLVKLSDALKINRSILSEVINEGLNKNFNDFVNEYRVAEVIRQFEEGRQQHLSIMGIASDAGFKSKATFNRVFRKLTGKSPSDYLSNQLDSTI